MADSDKIEGELKEKEGELTGDEIREKAGRGSTGVGRREGQGGRRQGRDRGADLVSDHDLEPGERPSESEPNPTQERMDELGESESDKPVDVDEEGDAA